MALLWPVVLACGDPALPALALDGPAQLVVDRIGPIVVPAPRPMLGGAVPEGIIYTLSTEGVARIDGDRVIAIGPGEVEVVAEWEGQRVGWKLRVELETMVGFVAPRLSLRSGDQQRYAVTTTVGGQGVASESVLWSTSDGHVLTVDAEGLVTARGPGVAYLTAQSRGASAMIEIEVGP